MSRNRSAVAAAVKLAEAAPLFAALGDETRLKLVGRLCVDGPLSIARLSEGAGVTRQAVTKHLQALDDAGLVRHSRRGARIAAGSARTMRSLGFLAKRASASGK